MTVSIKMRKRNAGHSMCLRLWWTLNGAGRSSSSWLVSTLAGSSSPSFIGSLLTATETFVSDHLPHCIIYPYVCIAPLSLPAKNYEGSAYSSMIMNDFIRILSTFFFKSWNPKGFQQSFWRTKHIGSKLYFDKSIIVWQKNLSNIWNELWKNL